VPRINDPWIRQRNAFRIYRCGEAEAIRLNAGRPLRDPGSLAFKYATQRTAANKRGIDWRLSFAEWLGIWEASGRLAQRGVGIGRYVMARHGDCGPYSVGNVSIQLAVANSRDGLLTRLARG